MTRGGSTRRLVATGLVALLVVVYAAVTWVRLARSGTRGTSFAIAVVVLAVAAAVVVVGVVVAGGRSRARYRALGARLPGWVLREVRADRGLADQVARLGTFAPGLRAGTRLTLGWSADGIGLWRGPAREPECVVLLPWQQVAAVGVGEGEAGARRRPAVVVDAAADARLVVVPRARPDGGFAPADARAVEAVVGAIRSVRDAGPQQPPVPQ